MRTQAEMLAEKCNCPHCGEEAWREEVDVGVGIICGPWGCSCGWSEYEQYDLTKEGGVQPDGTYLDQYGVLYPKDNPVAKMMRANIEVPE